MKNFTEWLREHEYLYDDLDRVDSEDPKAQERLAASQDFISGSREVPNPEYDPDMPWGLDGMLPQEYKDKYPNWQDKRFPSNREEIPANINLGNKRIVLSKYRHPPIVLPIGNKDIAEDHHHGRKPFGGLWYSFGNNWIQWSEQVPWRIRMFIHEIKINSEHMLILKNIEETSLLEKKYGSKRYDGFRYETLINWKKVAKDYGGVELQRNSMHHRDWQEPWDVASGCIWNKQALADTKLLYVYDVHSKKYVKPRNLGLYGGYSSKIKKPLPQD